MKLKICFCKRSHAFNRRRKQPIEWKNSFNKSTSDRGLISKIYEEFNKVNINKQHNSI